jgi:hypothetical protein
VTHLPTDGGYSAAFTVSAAALALAFGAALAIPRRRPARDAAPALAPS